MARWAAIAAVIGPLLFVVSQFVLANMLGADNDAQNLRDIDEQSGKFILANITRALGAALLALPLYYLFRAVALRSDSFRRQLVGVVIAAPLFIAAGIILTAIASPSRPPRLKPMARPVRDAPVTSSSARSCAFSPVPPGSFATKL